MASLEDDSIATVNSDDLNRMREAFQMQTHYGQPNHVADTQQQHDSYQHSEEQSKSTATDHVNASTDKPSTIPESVEPYQTPQSDSGLKPPRLAASKTAPETNMEVMLYSQSQTTPSQKAFSSLTKASSFHFGGDTQEYSAEDLQTIRESMRRPSDTTPGIAERTQYQGDDGYIDLEAFTSSQPGFEEGFLQETQTPETQQRQTQFRVPEKPIPETPAVSGEKTTEIPTSVATKSDQHFSQFFGPAPAIASPSKLFNQTQQPSSPAADMIFSDPLEQRPSPNASELNGASSSPRKWFSSPELGKGFKPSSAPGEPRAHYVSMKESQERRESRKAQLQQDRGVEDDEDDWLEESINTRRKRVRRTLSDNALRVTAPARPGSRRTVRKGSRPSIYDVPVTPAPAKRQQRVQFEAIDDEDQEEHDVDQDGQEEPTEDPDGVDVPMHEEEYNASVQEENDEYDELGQEIMMSQPPEADERDNASTVGSIEQDEPDVEDEQRDETMNDAEDEARNGDHAGQHTQRSTIADSQPDGQQQRSQVPIIQHIHPSVTTSFVPGSQHAGKTSEDQALLASSQRRSQMRVAASQVDGQNYNGTDKIPSSPPLLGVNSTLPENPAEEPLAPGDLPQETVRKSSTVPREIPESDLMDMHVSKPDNGVDDAEDDETQDTTRDGAPFSTARTHVSGSVQSPVRKSNVPSPRKPSQSQRSYFTDPSPRKQAGVRRFADFANTQTSTNGSFDLEADVDDVMQGIITEEDQQIWDQTSDDHAHARLSKRRKISHREASRTALDEKRGSHRTSRGRPELQDNIDKDGGAVDETNVTIAESDLEIARPESPPLALRDSPSKANEMLTPTTKDIPKVISGDSPSESVLSREKAGSDAVSQLVRTRGTATAKKTKQATYGRVSRRKSNRNELRSAKSIPRTKTSAFQEEAGENGEPTEEHAEVEAPDDHPTIEESNAAIDVDCVDVTAPVDHHVYDENNHATTQDDSFLTANPKRVFALFRGTPLAFYPATWLAATPDGSHFKIRFDDGTETQVETHHVRSLDLRVDDCVRVDLPGLRNKSWRITGFGAAAQTREERGLGTDAKGHIRIMVQAKSNRNSLPNDASSEAAADVSDAREVLVDRVYLTNTMWPAFSDREFNPPTKARAERAQTPLAPGSTPDSEAPPSRSRRAIVPTARAKGSGLRLSHLRETSTSSSRKAHSTGIFDGMAFAITYVSNDAEKADVTRLLGRHGGTILEGGFEELFELPAIGESTPKSPKDHVEQAETGLRLKAEYKDLGFVALVADKHSRRAKYMQALALGLPTLSGRWVIDSLDAIKNDTLVNDSVDPLPWDRYLLPAGESAYLGGAVRSRALTSYDIASADLQSTLSARATLLDGESVLIVAPKKDKAGWEKRRTYAFLTLALGAGQVKRVFDLDEAKALINEDPDTPKWLYVDSSVAKAESALFDKAGGKKRKRGTDVVSNKSSAARRNVRIVDDEFVVQSLILGALYE